MLLLRRFSQVQLFVTLWTVARQAPQSMEFSRQEYWSGLPFPPPGDTLDPGIEPGSPEVPALQADSIPLSHCHWRNSTLLHDNSHLILHSFVSLRSLITWDLFKGKDCGQVKKAMIVSLSPGMPSPSPRCDPICFWFPHPLWIKRRLYL